MKIKLSKRVISIFLCIALVMTYLPFSVMGATPSVNSVVIADPSTADAWEDILRTEADGARYAGRVWMDKSVYTDGDTVTLDRDGNANSSFVVDVDEENGEYFQTVFSALGSSMSVNTQTYATRPIDVVIVLDTSTSMTTNSGGKSRLQHMIESANKLLEDLLDLGDVRVAIVSFNADSETIIDLAKYDNGIVLSTNSYTNTRGGGIIYARDKDGALLGNDSGYTSGTNLQDGINRGMNILATAQNTSGRAPVAIVLADGRANRGVDEEWYNPTSTNVSSSDDAGIMLSTLLNAAYGRTRVEKNYNQDMTVYGIGIDLSSSSNDYIFLNPGAEGNNGFNASNKDDDVETAWNGFSTWKAGNTATLTFGSNRNKRTWTFDHNWPSSVGVTTAEIAANINYVDNYQDVSSANLGNAFDNILQQLSTGAFNPISTSKNSATGVENTPLIYVDNIGQYMEIKNIQALQVFGNTYNITKNSDGTYSVAAGSGVNPTTKEVWNTANDIDINILQNDDGTQQLRVYINQGILPILLDEITITTENGVTTRTIDEHSYSPLRLYYTVGIDKDILLPNGMVNTAKLDSGYSHINADGTVDFYSNSVGKLNTTNKDGDEFFDEGDAHVGFVPSHNNRYYYHQAHQEIFIEAKNANGSDIDWDDEMYGVLWEDGKYNLKAMTYEDYLTVNDTTKVYTYVTFTRPAGNGNEAEEVTYLVYTTWGDLKSAVTYYDKSNDAFLNDGAAIDITQMSSAVNSYKEGKNNVANNDLIAVLGLQSRRVSRLHNMFEVKEDNATGTAENSYAPEYNDHSNEQDDIHEHSEVIAWLGNNGKLTLPAAAGIKVTKDLTKTADGADDNEAFEIRVLLDTAYTTDSVADLFVADSKGEALDGNKYAVTASGGKILVTIYLANGESAIILGVPNDTDFNVTEAEHDKYKYTYSGADKTETAKIVEGVVTNNPIVPGSLYITKEVVPYKDDEPFPTDYEFAFEVTFLDKNGIPIKNKEFKLENNYDPTIKARSTDENGVMTGWLRHGETVHILGIPDGATVTVKEVNLSTDGNYTIKSYSSIDRSGETPDNDGKVTISSGNNATVVVKNTYTPKPTSAVLDLSIEKTLRVDTSPSNDRAFSFALEKWNGKKWESVKKFDNAVAWVASEIKVGEDNVKSFREDNARTLGDFTEAGTYIYQIYEVIPANRVKGMTYDRFVYTITVTVVDINGQLVANVTDQNGAAIKDIDNDGDLDFTAKFLNTENSATVSIDIEKRVDDTSKNPEISKAGFEFVAQTAAVNGGVWSVKPESEGGRSFSVYSDGTGSAHMTDIYREVGTYYYIISEKDGGKAGFSYSDAQYHITVVVTDDGTGDLTADMSIDAVRRSAVEISTVTDGTKGKIIFENTYDPTDAEINLNTLVKKKLENRNMIDGEFNFAIFKNGEAQIDANGNLTNINKAIATGTNDKDGKVTFTPDKIIFAELGKYEYDIIEVKGTKGGVTYDSIIYDLVVEITDNDQNGALEINSYFEDSVDATVTFKNTYNVEPIKVVVDGIKTLKVNNGKKELFAGDYTFGLYNEAGEKLAETTNNANGTFKFDAIEYGLEDIGKTYAYTVKEIAPDGSTDGSYSAGGVTWDGDSFTVTVKITDNSDGTLSAAVTGNGSQNIAFENVYSSKPVSIDITGKKILENRQLKANEFKFALYKTDRYFENPTPVNENITHDSEGDFSIDLGTLDEGRHYFLVKELIPAVRAKGIHYSAAEFNITIVVTDHGTGEMSYTKTVVNSGMPDVNNADIVFTNVYSPEPNELSLFGNKTYNGGKALTDDVFSVGLYNQDDELLQTSLIKADGRFAFENLIYRAADVGKTFIYTVKEIIPDGAVNNGDGTYKLGNNIYDGTVYTLTVEITDDDKDGELEIGSVITKGGNTVNEITFTNTFVPNSVTYKVQARKTYEKGLKGGDFEFKLVSADNKTNVNQAKKNTANGDIIFDEITFSKAGEYKFKLTEKKEGILSFILPSQAEYVITVTVVNENGVLRILPVTNENIKNTGETNLEFVNTYVIDGEDEITLRGTKTLTGDRTTVKANEFEFGLYDATGKLVEAVKNDANGNFEFDTLKFDETDVLVNGQKQVTYTVKEIAGDNARYTYDRTVYNVVVTVKDNDQGGVTASYTVNGNANGAIVFTNTYTNPAPVPYTPTAKKNYNKTLSGGEFKFKLEGEIGGTPVSQEKTNAAGGAITFDTLSFTEAGTYTFTVKEIDKLLGFIQYSTAEYELVIEIVDTKGVLSLGSIKVNNDPDGTIEFTNTYVLDGEDGIILSGIKTITGGRTTVEDNEFEFGLYDINGKLVEAVKNDINGNFQFDALKFDETDIAVNGQKQVTYTVKEIAGDDIRVTYDETVYTVVVTVKDDDKGGVKASYTVNGVADGAIAFTNIHTPKPEDITVDFDIVKTVVNKGSEKIGPDGFKFLLDALADGAEDITEVTDENGKAKFTLTFTEDDIGNTYTYKLTEVDDGKENVSYSTNEYTVTVAITLNNDNELVATLTENGEAVTEIVTEFENIYDYTPKTTPTPKPAPKPEADYNESPKTGNNANLILWFALLFVSGGGIFGTMLYGKKRTRKTK